MSCSLATRSIDRELRQLAAGPPSSPSERSSRRGHGQQEPSGDALMSLPRGPESQRGAEAVVASPTSNMTPPDRSPSPQENRLEKVLGDAVDRSGRLLFLDATLILNQVPGFILPKKSVKSMAENEELRGFSYTADDFIVRVNQEKGDSEAEQKAVRTPKARSYFLTKKGCMRRTDAVLPLRIRLPLRLQRSSRVLRLK